MNTYTNSPCRSCIILTRIQSALVLVAMLMMVSLALAHEYELGDLEVLHPIAAATPPGVKVGVGYLEIINEGEDDDRLIGARASFAGMASVHQTIIDGDVARMRKLEGGLLLPAKSAISLTPGDLHLMFENLDRQLVLGERYEATLIFENAGELDLLFSIENVVDLEAMDHENMDHENMDHENMDHENMDHENMNHGNMNHENMDHENMDHENMNHDANE